MFSWLRLPRCEIQRSSRTLTASIVVPAGEHTMSFNSPGCFPVSSIIFRASVHCLGCKLICLLPGHTLCYSRISHRFNKHEYIRRRASAYCHDRVDQMLWHDLDLAESAEQFQCILLFFFCDTGIRACGRHPSPTKAGVFGMVRMILTGFPNCSSSHASVFPGAIVMISCSSRMQSLISAIACA